MNQKAANHITVNQLVEALKDRLALAWAGKRRDGKQKFASSDGHADASIVGYFNLIHSSEVQVLGPIELAYLNSLNEKSYQKALARTFQPGNHYGCRGGRQKVA